MIWALLSSVYVMYLYRKLNAESSQSPENVTHDSVVIGAELDKLEQRMGSIEAMLARADQQETAR